MPKRQAKAAAGRKPYPALPSANLLLASHKHASVTAQDALRYLFAHWTAEQMKNSERSITLVQSLDIPAEQLRRFLKRVSEPTDTLLNGAVEHATDRMVAQKFAHAPTEYKAAFHGNRIEHAQDAYAGLRSELLAWSQVEGFDVMRVLVGFDANDQADRALEQLKLCPNSHFVWRLLVPAVYCWPDVHASLSQQVRTTNLEFMHESLRDFGRPLPIMEIAEFTKHYGNLSDELVRTVLTPAEFAYALSYGVFVLDMFPDGPEPEHKARPVIKLNQLYTAR